MSLSSSGIFHFTKSSENLLSILKGKFYGSRCKEILNHGGEKVPLYVPMISFCDMQLNQYIKMKTIYGRYGIGLSRAWAIKNKLNPVLYIDKTSNLIDNFIKALNASQTTVAVAGTILASNKTPEGILVTQNLNDSVSYLIYSLYHTKHYEDDLVRKEGTINNYRFYDEREWRYIPEFDCAVCQLKMTEAEYIAWRGPEDQPKPTLPEVELTFLAEDIEFILVKEDSEIGPMMAEIDKLDAAFFAGSARETLKTKIISFDRIEKNI